MIMADVFKILFLILGIILCTVSYWLIFQALFAARVEHSRRAILAHPYRVFLTGALVGGPAILLGIALLNGAGPLKFLGGVFLVTLLTLSLFGSTGLIRHIGEQLSAGDIRSRAGLMVVRGGVVVAVASVLPFVGWFFLIPVVLITGLGASVRMLWVRPSAAVVAAATDAVQA